MHAYQMWDLGDALQYNLQNGFLGCFSVDVRHVEKLIDRMGSYDIAKKVLRFAVE